MKGDRVKDEVMNRGWRRRLGTGRRAATAEGHGSRATRNRRAGLTLIELIVAFTVLLILSTMALPLTRIRVQREKERRLRLFLEDMRTAIDRYKDAADAGLLGQIDPDNHGYPESLEILVEGVEVSGGAAGAGGFPGMPGMGGQPGIPGQQQGGFGGNSAFGNRQGGSFGNRQGGAQSRSGVGSGSQSGGFGSNRGGSFGNRQSGSSGNRRGGAQSGSRSGSRTGFGSQSGGFGEDEEGEKKLRFLRKIPVDPITGTADWGMRSISDDPDSMSWGGRNVFDVYSISMDIALDGTRYSEW